MNIKSMRVSWVTVAVSVIAAAFVGHQTRGDKPATGPTKPGITAVIDLQKTINALDEYHAGYNEFRKMVGDLQAEANDRLKSAKLMKADLDDLQAGSDKYKELEAKLELALNEYQGFQELVKRKALISENRLIRTVYLNVKETVKQISMENNFAFVLIDDSVVETDPNSDIMKQMLALKLMYTSNDVDITQMVVDRMNAAFKAGTGKGGKPAP